MRQLTFKLILPLSVISFATITKWWYALPVDAPDTLFAGFPFPFVCDGWHTSMSLQIFVIELFADFLTYFLFWFIVIFCINRFWTKINPHKIVTIVLWVITGLMVSGASLIASNSDNLFYLKRPFDIDVMETGYKFVWQRTERPDYYKYHPTEQQKQLTKRLSFKDVSKIVADSSYSTWVELKDSSASLALHFQYKDTLAISYSPECWLMYPYKLDGSKIVIYWDNNIDTKYDFDIVKAINKTDKKYIGKPFMILELVNDTTLKATYPLKDLIQKINSSSKERTFFPDRYIIAQDGYL